MSELKVYEEMEDYVGYDDYTPTEMYDKSEVDKFIAGKDKEIAELRHHKYKRCLVMAAYCNAKIEEYRANYDAGEGFGDEWLYWIKFMRKWMRRWREFADKFKEAQT